MTFEFCGDESADESNSPVFSVAGTVGTAIANPQSVTR